MPQPPPHQRSVHYPYVALRSRSHSWRACAVSARRSPARVSRPHRSEEDPRARGEPRVARFARLAPRRKPACASERHCVLTRRCDSTDDPRARGEPRVARFARLAPRRKPACASERHCVLTRRCDSTDDPHARGEPRVARLAPRRKPACASERRASARSMASLRIRPLFETARRFTVAQARGGADFFHQEATLRRVGPGEQATLARGLR